MKTKAVRIYGKNDLRLDEFELPAIKDDEILAKVITDSLCMSTYKLAQQGADHKRAHQDLADHPAIVGHEFCGVIVEVGKDWQDQFKPGMRFTLQPDLNYQGSLDTAGYSFEYFGGDCTYCIFPAVAMKAGAIFPFEGDSFFKGSLGEPMSCIIAGYNVMYHTKPKVYQHFMGIKENGNLIIMGGCGPMGLGAINYGIVGPKKPKRIVVTDVDDAKLARAESVITPEFAKQNGVELLYVNTAKMEDAYQGLMDISEGHGYDDVFVYVPITPVVELGNKVLSFDGCMNFFAGPIDQQFSGNVNFYNCHYAAHHILGVSGGNNDDLIEANELAAKNITNPAVMITHVGGLDSVIETTLNLPKIPGGKKLVYTQIDMPMTAISDFEKLGQTDPFYKALDESCKANQGLWNAEAEKILLEHFQVNVDA